MVARRHPFALILCCVYATPHGKYRSRIYCRYSRARGQPRKQGRHVEVVRARVAFRGGAAVLTPPLSRSCRFISGFSTEPLRFRAPPRPRLSPASSRGVEITSDEKSPTRVIIIIVKKYFKQSFVTVISYFRSP